MWELDDTTFEELMKEIENKRFPLQRFKDFFKIKRNMAKPKKYNEAYNSLIISMLLIFMAGLTLGLTVSIVTLLINLFS